jgi:hypothetical protein
VRFIVRARGDAFYQVRKNISAPRAYGKAGRIELDAWVRLGVASAQAHPVGRLIRARVGGELLILVTGERRMRAEQVLDAYRKRERIEQFHRMRCPQGDAPLGEEPLQVQRAARVRRGQELRTRPEDR